jgi:hypothetical protein
MAEDTNKNIINAIKESQVKEAMAVGFTEAQARYLVEKLTNANLGIGGLFV